MDGWAVIYTEKNGGEILPAHVRWLRSCQGASIDGTLKEKLNKEFLLVGYFDREDFAQNALKYTKTKFFRAIFQFQRLCQFNPYDSPSAFKGQIEIACNDEHSWFNSKYGLDWSKSISEIDQQLYDLFRLPQHCIDFINSRFGDVT